MTEVDPYSYSGWSRWQWDYSLQITGFPDDFSVDEFKKEFEKYHSMDFYIYSGRFVVVDVVTEEEQKKIIFDLEREMDSKGNLRPFVWLKDRKCAVQPAFTDLNLKNNSFSTTELVINHIPQVTREEIVAALKKYTVAGVMWPAQRSLKYHDSCEGIAYIATTEEVYKQILREKSSFEVNRDTRTYACKVAHTTYIVVPPRPLIWTPCAGSTFTHTLAMPLSPPPPVVDCMNGLGLEEWDPERRRDERDHKEGEMEAETMGAKKPEGGKGGLEKVRDQKLLEESLKILQGHHARYSFHAPSSWSHREQYHTLDAEDHLLCVGAGPDGLGLDVWEPERRRDERDHAEGEMETETMGAEEPEGGKGGLEKVREQKLLEESLKTLPGHHARYSFHAPSSWSHRERYHTLDAGDHLLCVGAGPDGWTFCRKNGGSDIRLCPEVCMAVYLFDEDVGQLVLDTQEEGEDEW